MLRGCDGILCDGAVRSGKTVCMALGFLLWSMTRFEDQFFALCGRSVEGLRRNVTNLLPQWTEGIFRIEAAESGKPHHRVERGAEERLLPLRGPRRVQLVPPSRASPWPGCCWTRWP